MLLCCGYGALFGGRDGRWVALVYISAVALTVPAQMLQRSWGDTHWPVFLVDLCLFLGLYGIAMRSRHYWPVWMAGFHLITMTTHLASAVAPSFAAKVYFGLATFWAVPKLLIILIGVSLDRRAGITVHVDDTGSGTTSTIL